MTLSRWYLNGNLDDTENFDLDATSEEGIMEIGFAQTWSGYYEGDLGDVRVYDRALTQSEVQNIYTTETPEGGTEFGSPPGDPSA